MSHYGEIKKSQFIILSEGDISRTYVHVKWILCTEMSSLDWNVSQAPCLLGCRFLGRNFRLKNLVVGVGR